jgi:hypothetical protein
MNPRVVFATLLLASLSPFVCTAQSVVDGVIDMRSWDPPTQPIIALDGEWKFYWQQLVTPREITPDDKVPFAALSIPWNEQVIGGNTLPDNGYASYAATILLPGTLKSVSFSVPAVFNSYAFWVNDSLLCEGGKVGRNESESSPQWIRNTLVVAFQISNFEGTRGGCAETLRIGETKTLSNLDSAFTFSGLSLIVFFTIAAIIGFIVFFIFRPPTFLYFALLSLSFALRFLFSDLYLYYETGLTIPWAIAARIEYLTVPFIIMSAAAFIASLYPQEFHRLALLIIMVLNGVACAFLAFAPTSFLSPVLLAVQIQSLLFIAYVIIAILRALTFNRGGAWVTAVGLAIFACVGFYNIYTFLNGAELNRTVIHVGYGIAILLNLVSLFYRTPIRVASEDRDTLRYTDLYR